MPEVQQPPQISNWTDVHGVCEHLKVSKETIYRMVRDKTIPFHKINSALRFDLNEVDAAIKTKVEEIDPAIASAIDAVVKKTIKHEFIVGGDINKFLKTESPAKRNSSPISASKGRKSDVKKKAKKK